MFGGATCSTLTFIESYPDYQLAPNEKLNNSTTRFWILIISILINLMISIIKRVMLQKWLLSYSKRYWLVLQSCHVTAVQLDKTLFDIENIAVWNSNMRHYWDGQEFVAAVECVMFDPGFYRRRRVHWEFFRRVN